MSREWKTGEVAIVTFDNATGVQRAEGLNRFETHVALVDADHVGTVEPAGAWFVFGATSRIGATWECVREVRPLVVLDAQKLVEGVTAETAADIVFAQATQLEREEPTATKSIAVLYAIAAAIDAVVDKKPYRLVPGVFAPWPEVGECHSRDVDGHECPQCAWEHDHDWVAWTNPRGAKWPPNAVPIRCSKCGGRKCDRDDCGQQRHTHTHADEETQR